MLLMLVPQWLPAVLRPGDVPVSEQQEEQEEEQEAGR